MRLLECCGVKSVLVVEDNDAMRMFMSLALSRLGIPSDEATDGEIAIAMFLQRQYPVVFMDIQMPKIDGIAATKAIREFEKANGLPPSNIVAVTNGMYSQECREAGTSSYFEKPSTIEQVADIVRAVAPELIK